jgi:hypothetical protein
LKIIEVTHSRYIGSEVFAEHAELQVNVVEVGDGRREDKLCPFHKRRTYMTEARICHARTVHRAQAHTRARLSPVVEALCDHAVALIDTDNIRKQN